MTGWSSSERLIGLIGNPVSRSPSPRMHNAAFRHMGLDFHYMSFEIASEKLGSVMEGLRWIAHGLNVTIPFKTEVLRFVDELSEEAEVTGAVNTVVVQKGRMKGYNTDVVGVLQPFRRRGISLLDTRALVIGAGGASRACIVALNRLGCSEFMILNRSRDRFERLEADFSPRLGVNLSWYPLDAECFSSCARRADVVVNATPLGTKDAPLELPLKGGIFRSGQVVFDVVYMPTRTKLLELSERCGSITIPGYEMLLEQGMASFKLWTGLPAPREVMERALMEALVNEG